MRLTGTRIKFGSPCFSPLSSAVLVTALVVFGSAACGGAEAQVSGGKPACLDSILLPKPKSVSPSDGFFVIGPQCTVAVDPGSSEGVRDTAALLVTDLAAAGIKSKTSQATEGGQSIRLSIGKAPADVPADRAEQGYSLEVTGQGIELVGWGEPGLYYATRTLLQLIDHGQVRHCSVKDWPDYRYRMVHYDFAREQTCNMAYIKKVIDRLSDFKVNMMGVYLETRFQFKKHPKISVPDVMTPEQARELDAYAKRKHVELVPQVNVLGHLEQALAVKEYRHLAADLKSPFTINPLDPETPGFIEDLIGEVAPCFSSKYFHIGGDEAWGLEKNPQCGEFIKKYGAEKLFADHYSKVIGMVTKLGKRPMMWGDMLLQHPKTVELLPKEVIIFDWHYEKSKVETLKFFTDRGFEVFACPATSGFGKISAPFGYAQENIYTFIGQGPEGKAIGECTCSWEVRMGLLFDCEQFGILLSADRAWNLAGCKLDDFNQRFCKVFYGMDDLRVIEYFQAISDGYAAIGRKSLGGWATAAVGAFWDIDDNIKNFGARVNQNLYEKTVAHREKCLALLDDVRREAKRNQETLLYADVPAHTGALMTMKIYLCMKADALAKEGKNDEARRLLQQVMDELDYLDGRFKGIIKTYGGSIEDLARVERLRVLVKKRMSKIEEGKK